MELIIKAAIQSSRIPARAKEATMGTVPYIHSGERMPRAEAGSMPHAPHCFLWRVPISRWMCPLRKTDTSDPTIMPKSQ